MLLATACATLGDVGVVIVVAIELASAAFEETKQDEKEPASRLNRGL